MGFWDNVNDEFKKAVEEGWSAVKENARIGKLKYRGHTLRKEAQRQYALWAASSTIRKSAGPTTRRKA